MNEKPKCELIGKDGNVFTTRIVKLPKHDRIIIGRDLAEIFEPGRVFEVKKYMSEYVIRDIGQSALVDRKEFPNVHGNVSDILKSGVVFYTDDEWKLKQNSQEDE